jgi:hypothetical protein
MEQLSIQQLFAPKGEFCELPLSSDPILSSSYELSPSYLAMVREQFFSGRDNENPYHHLQEFEELCSCMKISRMTQETIKWKLFPFFPTETSK